MDDAMNVRERRQSTDRAGPIDLDSFIEYRPSKPQFLTLNY